MANETRHDFTGRVAVVTGGGQGIGLAVVRRLLGAGAQVAIWDTDAAEPAFPKFALISLS